MHKVYRTLLIGPLAVLGLAAMLLPARHGWLPLWPVGLVEVIAAGEAGEIQTSLAELLAEPADSLWVVRGQDGASVTVSRDHDAVTVVSQPGSAVVLEDREGARYFGYLIGLRESGDGPLMDNAAAWLEPDYLRFDGRVPANRLVFQYPHGDTVEFEVASLRGYYRPNRMGRADKLRLLLARLKEKWGSV